MGLVVNENKTNFMVCGERVPGVGQRLKTHLESGEHYAFERVSFVTYLGICFTGSEGMKD